jgi:arylsulfatase A-like enzyme
MLRRLFLGLALFASGCGRHAPPDVVLVVIDTLRADALGLYGAPRENAPHLAELARGGVVFENVVAPSSWTKTSMASILTGLDPARHGVRGVDHVLPAELPTLARLLRDAGWRTLGVQTNPWLHARFGFDAGFERYEFDFFGSADEVNARGLELLDAERGERPVFLYLHYMDVHAPYKPDRRWFDAPPLDVPGRGPLPDARLEALYRKRELGGPELDRRVRALYEAELRGLDDALGRLFEALRARGLLEGGVLVVTSDHGESFGEHGEVQHGRTFYPEVYAVPLVLHAPGRVPAGARIDARVRSIDVMPTLLALAGLALPEGVQGEPLLPMRPGAIRPRVARGAVGLNDQAPDRDLAAVVSDDRLYLHERRSGRVELYDLAADPGALRDLGPAHPDAARLAPLAEPDGAGAPVPGRVELDETSRQQLEALGYLDAGD